MPTITCSNAKRSEFNFSQLEIGNSQQSGNHTTQHSTTGEVICNSCRSQTEVNYVWYELDDTGETVGLYFTWAPNIIVGSSRSLLTRDIQ